MEASHKKSKTQVPNYAFRFRAILIGLLLIPPNSYWVIQMEKVGQGPHPTTISLFANAIFILALLILLNNLVRRLLPRQALSQAELLGIYTMVCIGAALSGHDMVPIVIQMMCHPFRFASPGNQWMELFGDYLPQWLTVSDPAALKGYYEGGSSLYTPHNLLAWLGPSLWWIAFIVVMLFVMICINTLVRRQWMEREKLTFPIVQLPLAMTEPGGEIWRNKLLWLGFAIAGGIDLINGLAFLFPSIPAIPVKHIDLMPFITTKPWKAVAWLPYSFYPFVIGLGYLLPADLLFSCWFFYFFWKMQLVLSSAMAWDYIPQFPFVKQQAFGGYMAVLVMLTWTARGYLKQMWLSIVGRPSELDDSGEAMSYRIAALGAIGGTTLLIAFFWRMGLSPLLGIAAFIIYFAVSTAIARMRAELGPPVHDLHFSGPDTLITQAIGTDNISTQNLTALSYFNWFNRAYRGHPMAIEIEGMKMAQVTGSGQKRLFVAMMAAALIGGLAAFWAYLHAAYRLGSGAKFVAGLWFGAEPCHRLEVWLRNPTPPNHYANAATGVGFLFCLLLSIMRLRFFGWPFHPIGYAISGSWSMNLVWLPLAIAWLIKVLILHFSGLKLYKQAMPFFLGLILGQMIVGSAWSLIGLILDMPTYSFWGK